ncbi:YaiO family outer membrane beta-barrel protein [Altererythrobacter confluentis]|uniref:YaiO family outer membrane beta-barrel protein n=1 Tax=Allopontixanthobacter confluentis TaxID=1849021 RepID=A0A6L7GDS9_9SPHN|nr:YaiO family outer membrane beta-barrel protein [Allopontixanthobacter confluentis]MXP13616.1 YaiO family outer membrane beta-barrel protein [Allopontixanthobacter confluentis]
MAQAQQSIEQALAIEPANLDLQIARANILLWKGEIQAAITQADAVRSIDASYPGLADFDTAFLRQSRLQSQGSGNASLLSVSVAAGLADLKFASGRAAQWEHAVIAASYGKRSGTVVVAELDAERREQTDVRFSARATTRMQTGTYYIAAGITPDASFRDDWRIAAGADALLSRNLQGSLDLRLAHFGSGVFTAIEPGVTYRVAPRLSAGGRMINLFSSDGRYRAGGAVRLDYETLDDGAFFVGAARYPDTEAGVTQTLQAYSVGAAWAVDRHLRLRIAAAQETRQKSYRNRSVNLGLEFRFDNR